MADLNRILSILASTSAAATAATAAERPSPATINTLPAARRYIVRHLAHDRALLSRISRLKASQHALERDWAAGRAEIQRRHASRAENSVKLAGILQSLGVAAMDESRVRKEEEELRDYDRKVHRRCGEMYVAMEQELRAAGVPWLEDSKQRAEVVGLLEDLADDEVG